MYIQYSSKYLNINNWFVIIYSNRYLNNEEVIDNMTQKDTCDIYCYDEAKVKRIQGEMQKEDISSVATGF